MRTQVLDRSESSIRSIEQSINQSVDRSIGDRGIGLAGDRPIGRCVRACLFCFLGALSRRSSSPSPPPPPYLARSFVRPSLCLSRVPLCVHRSVFSRPGTVRARVRTLSLGLGEPTSRYYWVLGVCRSIDRTHADLSIGSVSVFVRALAPCFPARSRFSALTTSHTHASTFLSASTSSRRASASPTP